MEVPAVAADHITSESVFICPRAYRGLLRLGHWDFRLSF